MVPWRPENAHQFGRAVMGVVVDREIKRVGAHSKSIVLKRRAGSHYRQPQNCPQLRSVYAHALTLTQVLKA